MNIQKILQDITLEYDSFAEDYGTKLEEIENVVEKLKHSVEQIKESWSGSCFGYHHKLYYGEFTRPPIDERFSVEWGSIHGFSNQWKERSVYEVKEKISSLVGGNFDIDLFEKNLKEIAENAEDMQANIDLLISGSSMPNKNPLSSIKKIHPKDGLKSHLKNYMSRSMMSRDSEAVAEGVFIPTIMYYEAVVHEAELLLDSLKSMGRAVKNFNKWCKLQPNFLKKSDFDSEKNELSLLHNSIAGQCKKLFKSGDYAEAVEKGFKIVRDRLRELTGYETGSEAFGKGKLHISGSAATNVDKDFNNGVKFLTMAIDNFRNEKSHTSKAKIANSQQAYEYLTLSSLALNLLDKAEITK